jgi:UrcA family protein
MNANDPVRNTKAGICFAAVAACAALSGPALANDLVVTIRIPVAFADLDISQPGGARELYRRLREAARTVCSNGNRVDLEPLTDFDSCYEKALGNAVRSVNQPQLTIAYLGTHTLRDAATQGIDVSQRVAAK